MLIQPLLVPACTVTQVDEIESHIHRKAVCSRCNSQGRKWSKGDPIVPMPAPEEG
jgi:hypothetical protein